LEFEQNIKTKCKDDMLSLDKYATLILHLQCH
jgi:hypothetical protein